MQTSGPTRSYRPLRHGPTSAKILPRISIRTTIQTRISNRVRKRENLARHHLRPITSFVPTGRSLLVTYLLLSTPPPSLSPPPKHFNVPPLARPKPIPTLKHQAFSKSPDGPPCSLMHPRILSPEETWLSHRPRAQPHIMYVISEAPIVPRELHYDRVGKARQPGQPDKPGWLYPGSQPGCKQAGKLLTLRYIIT